MKRRNFIKGASAAVLATGAPVVSAGSDLRGTAGSGETFDPNQWKTIEAVQDHLLPSETDAPGGREANATAYLDLTLADPGFDPDVRGFILKGIGWLNEIAEERERRPFHLVEPVRREDLLRQIAGSGAGERWLSTLVTYTLEALLADPLYGGNPNGIGWTWLEHDPGRPRPTPNKIYGRLGKT
ncbi:MAG: gluconate 2-dehydrogenase subunit 3 family protein [Pseudomonadota bacterium]|nr:gluconate 2-dehydrogenase subunit 3 family protein [Pseudomonadota bacterium]